MVEISLFECIIPENVISLNNRIQWEAKAITTNENKIRKE